MSFYDIYDGFNVTQNKNIAGLNFTHLQCLDENTDCRAVADYVPQPDSGFDQRPIYISPSCPYVMRLICLANLYCKMEYSDHSSKGVYGSFS